MAGQMTGTQRTYIMEDSNMPMFTAVARGTADGSVKIPTADNESPVGVVTNDERLSTSLGADGDQTGRNIAVQVDGYATVELDGAVSYGDNLILAIGGKVKAMPADAGTYNVIGTAEKAGSDGDFIPMKMELKSIVVSA